MVGQFKKAYLHRSKSRFSHTCENSKMFNITSKYFSFFSNKPPSDLVTVTEEIFNEKHHFFVQRKCPVGLIKAIKH